MGTDEWPQAEGRLTWDDGRSGDVHRLKKIKLYLAFAPGYCYSYARAPTPLCPYAPISYEFISVPYPTGN